MSWATLEQAKQHLRYDADDTSNDAILQAYLDATAAAINSYITATVTPANTPLLRTAQLLYVGYLDQYRNAEADAPVNGNYLPQPITALLWPLRTPAVS